ncbi:MAG: hypothetical protein SWY16_05995 [Cyanobacteriota bacterium]|nr:hypothetical protein [Cyanobacteriota bacterium]
MAEVSIYIVSESPPFNLKMANLQPKRQHPDWEAILTGVRL